MHIKVEKINFLLLWMHVLNKVISEYADNKQGSETDRN